MPPDQRQRVHSERRALRRSRIGAEILLVLLEHGPLSLPDLARLVGADPRNVRGALLGEETAKRTRYRVEHAVIVLGLVEELELEGQTVYELTPAGAIVAARLGSEVDRRRGVRPRVRT